MQKKLIALAIAGLASGAAFAQSNVTISGNIDLGYTSTSFGTTTIMDAKTAALHNGSSTSALNFSGKEDIGGGTSVGFFLGTDYVAGASGTALFNVQNYLELAGNFGSLKAGTLNTHAHTLLSSVAQPFGTALGGANSSNFGRLSYAAIGATAVGTTPVTITAPVEGETAAGNSGARAVRSSNTLRYDTPAFNGFKGSLMYSAKNSDTATGAATQSPSTIELGLAYANGPLNLGFANYQINQGALANGLAAGEKVTHNVLAGNYAIGNATVYGGWTSSKNSGNPATVIDSRSWNLAVKYAVTSVLAVQGNIVKVDVKTAGNQDRNLTGLGLDYALSKRSTAYARYETGDNDKANTAGADGKFTRWAVGLRHSF